MGEDERSAAEVGGFLPPEPPGPDPDLGGPPQPKPPQVWQQPPPGQGWQPGWPPQQWQAPPQQWQAPPQQWQAPHQQWHAPPGWHPAAPPVPGNSPAVAGFVLSVVAAALLVVSFGTSSIISLACALLGIVFSRKGRRNVEEGRTPKNGDLARAGFITGIVALVLTVLATAAWIAVIVASSGGDAGGAFS